MGADVLNSKPLTDTVLLMVREAIPDKSSVFMFDSVTTLIEVIGDLAPVNNRGVGRKCEAGSTCGDKAACQELRMLFACPLDSKGRLAQRF